MFDRAVTQETKNADFTYTPLSQVARKYKRRAVSWMKKEVKKVGEKFEERIEHHDEYNRGAKLQAKYTDKTKETDALEVWFAGCHTGQQFPSCSSSCNLTGPLDVGGGSVINATRFSLARISLRWMIRQCFLTNSGIQFAAGRLHEVGLDPRKLYPFVVDRPPALPVSILNLPNHETGTSHRPERGKEKPRGRSINDADDTCQNCIEDEMHFHMIGHVESQQCDYADEYGELALDEEHEVST